VRAWSGLGRHIARCLELAGCAVARIGPLERRVPPAAQARRLGARLRGEAYALDRDPAVARRYAEEVDERLARGGCDLVFSPGTVPIAHLPAGRPVAFWADATFAALLRTYPRPGAVGSLTVRNGMRLDDRALARASVAFYASEWAARSAVEDHGADPAHVEVVPFGANLAIRHDRRELAELVGGRRLEPCRLLFVGVDWERKGGDTAVEAARLLNARGLATTLDVAGCTPPRPLPEFVRVHGFVDKSSPAGEELLRDLYRAAHVLVHPARAECFGVVFCEAAAHGVLSVAARVGGIPSALHDGVTGVLVDPAAGAEEYAQAVWRLVGDPAYAERALGAFDEYERALSWEAQAARLRTRLAAVVDG
jgi:glycosyltransferase involved in cell wall biosynthesis